MSRYSPTHLLAYFIPDDLLRVALKSSKRPAPIGEKTDLSQNWSSSFCLPILLWRCEVAEHAEAQSSTATIRGTVRDRQVALFTRSDGRSGGKTDQVDGYQLVVSFGTKVLTEPLPFSQGRTPAPGIQAH